MINNVLAYILISLVLLYLGVRAFWTFKNIRAFLYVMASYANLNKIEVEEIAKYCKISSWSSLIFDLTNWDFTKYIVSKDKYFEACSFHIKLMVDALGLDKTNDTKQSAEDTENKK